MLEGEANGELANAEQQENDNNVEVMSDENKKILNKRLVTMLGDELDKFVKELEAVSPVEREKALATLQAVANEFFVAGGEASVAAALVRSTFLTTATSRQARAKAINERLWTGMVNDTTFIAGLRQALDWAPLTIENITEMTPLEKNRSILPRWQVISELLKASASASSLTEAQRELFVAARVHKLLMTQLVWATRLPQLKAVWSGGEEEKFITTMRRISETHDRVLKQSESEELTMPPATVAFVSAPERCYTCGRVGHMAFQCSQTQQLCYSCRQPGHIAKSCPMAGSASAAFARGGGRGGGRGGRGGYGGGSRGNVVATTVASEKPVVKKSMFDYPYSYSQTSFVVLTIDEKIRAVWESAPLLVRVLAQGGPQLPAVECEMLVDTGAIPSVVSSRFVASIGAATRPSRTRCIRGVGDTSTLIAGETTIGVTMGGRSFAVTALVAETALFDFLLGTRGMRAQGVEPVKIEIDESGGRVCVAGSAWVPAIGWTPSHVAVETVHVLRDESAAWRSTPSSVFLPVAGVGVLHAQLELGNDEGLSVADVLEVMGYATELPVAMTTGQEAHVAEALRAIAAADRDGREGAAWTLPNLEPSEPLVAAGPELQGPDREAYKSVAIGPDLGVEVTALLRSLCEEYRDVLGGSKSEGATLAPPMNKRKRAIKLVLYPNARLDEVAARFRRTSPDDANMLEEFALRMESEGRLRREMHAPATSLALVVKRDDGSRRVVVNFGPLNQQLLSNHFPLPRIDTTLDFLSKGAYRSSYDLWLCFHQFGVSSESIPLTATWFSPTLLMSWLVAPMGIKTIPAEVQSVMSVDFNNEFTIVYIDDVMQVVPSVEKLVPATSHVFEVCRKNGWTLNARKCKLGFRELPMLGKVVGDRVIKPLPAHLDGIRNYGMPTTHRQLRAFNGMFTALAQHLPTAAATIRSLYAAAGGAKQGSVVWSDEMREAYRAALQLLSSPEVVVPFDESRPLLLLTDWSLEGGAGVFAHLSRDESHFEVIDTFSHANSRAESNYGAAEGEIAMVRLALKQFPHLMLGRKVHWITDALTMRSAFEAFRTSTSPRIRRTVAELQHVEIVVIDSPGAKHRIADALSRNPSFGAGDRDARAETETESDDGEVVALVALTVQDVALPLVGGQAGEVAQSMFDPLSAAERDEIEAFRFGDNVELQETKEATKARWAARTADDPDLAELRELARRNDATLAAGGEIVVPADRRSLEAMVPRHSPDGLLMVMVGGEGPLRVVVPAGCESEAAQAVHTGARVDGGGAAHWHARRTVAIARRWMWWRTMYQDIVKWCHQCTTCQRHRLLLSKTPANLGDSEAGREPQRFGDWQLDSYVLGGVRFFTAVEVYSGLVLGCPVPDATSLSFVQAFEQMIVQSFGVPLCLWLDGGSEMKKHFAALCLAYGIETVEGLAYNPPAQSRVERAHRTLQASVTKAQMEGSKAPVATILMRAAHAINIAPSEHGEGMSPYRLLHGVEPTLPFTRFLVPDLSGARSTSPEATLRDQVEELGRVHAVTAAEREADRLERRAKHEATVARTHGATLALQPGDAVWAILPPVGVGSKLEQSQAWSGPWEVTSFDEKTGRVELAYLSDNAVRYQATVHVRNTRSFSAVQPLEPRHLLDEVVFPKGWEKSSVPLGGMEHMPERVRAGLDNAIAEAARQAGLSDATRRREEAVELEAKAKEAEAQRAEAAKSVLEQAEAKRKEKAEMEKAKARDRQEAEMEQMKPMEVVRVDAGQKVLVRRKDGKEVWVDLVDAREDPRLKLLLATFGAVGRANRVNRGGS